MPLKLYKRKDSKAWWIRGTVHGQTVYESTGTHDKEVAEAIRTKREAGIVSDHVFGPKATRTFAHAVESYLKAGGDARFVGSVDDDGKPTGLLGHFYDTRLNDITQNDLDEAARALYPNAQPETRNRQCYTPFIAVWNHAVKNGWADVRMWQRPRKQKGTNVVRFKAERSGTKPVDYERAARFVNFMSPAPAMLMTALFYTGLRPIEAFALRGEDVDVDKQWLVVRSSKTGEPRGVPLHSFLCLWLPALVERAKDGKPLFRGPRGEPYKAVQEGGGGLKTAINGARRRSGIMDVSPYTGRHTVSTGLVIAGVHPHIKDQILGHAATDMSRHYTNVPQQPLIEAIDRLPVPELWRRLPWVADPAKWWSRLAGEQGKRTDLENAAKDDGEMVFDGPPCFVYVVGAEDPGERAAVKIGQATSPENRLRELQTASPVKLSIHALWQFPTRGNANAVERACHRKFKDRRKSGEWFDVDVNEVSGFIDGFKGKRLGLLRVS